MSLLPSVLLECATMTYTTDGNKRAMFFFRYSLLLYGDKRLLIKVVTNPQRVNFQILIGDVLLSHSTYVVQPIV